MDVDKIELHCHLDGLIDLAMLDALVRRGITVPITPEALAAIVPMRSMEQWVGAYTSLVAPCMASALAFVPLLEIHIANLIEQQVVCAEIMVSGLLQPNGDAGEVVDHFRALRDAADRASRGRIEVELLVAIGRGSRARVQRQAERILLLARHGLIAGVAIAGDESACTIASIASILAGFREAGLGLEIHAGETLGPASIWDALEHGRPDRIGHGITAFTDERLVDELRARDVHLEMCPTSNVCLGVVADLAHHPIARARELGMSFSVNTDDPGPFGCTMASEFAALEQTLGFTQADFAAICANARRARFTRR